jgi:hypothetical protein
VESQPPGERQLEDPEAEEIHVAVPLIMVALLAAYAPARRTSIGPVRALREE